MIKTAVAQNKSLTYDEVVAVIVSAIVSMGYSEGQISSIRPVCSEKWRLAGRLQAL